MREDGDGSVEGGAGPMNAAKGSESSDWVGEGDDSAEDIFVEERVLPFAQMSAE